MSEFLSHEIQRLKVMLDDEKLTLTQKRAVNKFIRKLEVMRDGN